MVSSHDVPTVVVGLVVVLVCSAVVPADDGPSVVVGLFVVPGCCVVVVKSPVTGGVLAGCVVLVAGVVPGAVVVVATGVGVGFVGVTGD